MPDSNEIQPLERRKGERRGGATIICAEKGTSTVAILAAVAVGILLAFMLYLIVELRGRVASLEADMARQSAQTKVIEDRLHLTNKNVEAGIQALGSKVGQELATRTAELKAQQERAAAKLAAEQQATNKEVANVNSAVSGVKTELGGAQSEIASTRSDLAGTRSDLAATKAKLESAIGDLNVHSGLIAKSHDDLEFLKHKGDRNYFEFNLKRKQRSPVSTVSLELKKTDPKKSRFTLNVYADDHTIEKKDRSLGEPLQFYTGRDRQLYEVVVFHVGNDGISGYLATPK